MNILCRALHIILTYIYSSVELSFSWIMVLWSILYQAMVSQWFYLVVIFLIWCCLIEFQWNRAEQIFNIQTVYSFCFCSSTIILWLVSNLSNSMPKKQTNRMSQYTSDTVAIYNQLWGIDESSVSYYKR